MKNVKIQIVQYSSGSYMCVQDICTQLKVKNSFDQISAECSFTIVYQDQTVLPFTPSVGDAVIFTYKGIILFKGKIITSDKESTKQINITAYDYSWWLCKNKITKNYSSISVKDALEEIYKLCGVPYNIDLELGDYGKMMIEDHLVKDKPASQVLSAIYSDVTAKSGVYYYINQRPEDGVITITEADRYASGLVISQSSRNKADGNLISYKIHKSMSDMITAVAVYDEEGSPLDITSSVETKEDENNENTNTSIITEKNIISSEAQKDGRYGTIISNIIASSDEDVTKVIQKANKELADHGKLEETVTVECIGDINYKVAYGVKVMIPDTDYYDIYMYIVDAEWIFNSDGEFIAKLGLSPSKHHNIITWDDIESKEDEEEGDSESGSDLWDRIEAELKKHLGVPYVWGGKAPPGMDCSGYIAYVYNQFKTELEITSNSGELTSYTIAMMNEGKDVTSDFPNNLKPGDIIFPHSGHVVAYLGDNQVIHEPKTGDVCKISTIYFDNPAKVIRVIPDSAWTSKKKKRGSAKEIITEEMLSKLSWVKDKMFIDDLNECLNTYEINTRERIHHFLAQCAHECGVGHYMEELGSGSSSVSGGSKYKGAGCIQLTHDYNYKKFADAMGDQRIYSEGCSYVAKNYPWSASGWWWSDANMNKLIDGGASVEQVTKRVNGGYNGLSERKKYYNMLESILPKNL